MTSAPAAGKVAWTAKGFRGRPIEFYHFSVILLCHKLRVCAGLVRPSIRYDWLKATWASRQSLDQSADQAPADRGDRPGFMALGDGWRRVSGSLRVAQGFSGPVGRGAAQGEKAALGNQKTISRDAQAGMVVVAAPVAALIVVEPG